MEKFTPSHKAWVNGKSSAAAENNGRSDQAARGGGTGGEVE